MWRGNTQVRIANVVFIDPTLLWWVHDAWPSYVHRTTRVKFTAEKGVCHHKASWLVVPFAYLRRKLIWHNPVPAPRGSVCCHFSNRSWILTSSPFTSTMMLPCGSKSFRTHKLVGTVNVLVFRPVFEMKHCAYFRNQNRNVLYLLNSTGKN